MKTVISNRHIQNCKLLIDRIELLKQFKKNSVIAEFGVDTGEFSKQIYEICKPKKLFLVDVWDTSRYNETKKNDVIKWSVDMNEVEILINDSVETLYLMPVDSLDYVYIDTVHDYQHTYNELVACKNKVKDTGLICGHDYTQGNIEKPLRYGVVEAVNDFCIKYNYEFIYLTHESDRHLSFAIKRIISE